MPRGSSWLLPAEPHRHRPFDKADDSGALPSTKKTGRAGARPEFREETPRRRAVGSSLDDRYCTAQFKVRRGDVNPRRQNVRAYQHFPVDKSWTWDRRATIAAHKDQHDA